MRWKAQISALESLRWSSATVGMSEATVVSLVRHRFASVLGMARNSSNYIKTRGKKTAETGISPCAALETYLFMLRELRTRM